MNHHCNAIRKNKKREIATFLDVMEVQEVNGEGFDQHVHVWWDYVLDRSKLLHHLDQLRSGALHHPSAGQLLCVFLDNSRREDESKRQGNASLLLECAALVVKHMEWSLQQLEQQIEQHGTTEEALRCLLRSQQLSSALPSSVLWDARHVLRVWRGEEQRRGEVLGAAQWLRDRGHDEQEKSAVRRERCRALAIAGMREVAREAAPDDAWRALLSDDALFASAAPLPQQKRHRIASVRAPDEASERRAHQQQLLNAVQQMQPFEWDEAVLEKRIASCPDKEEKKMLQAILCSPFISALSWAPPNVAAQMKALLIANQPNLSNKK